MRTEKIPPLDAARQQLAADNQRLANFLARRFWNGCSRAVPLEELRQDAMVALVQAAGRFDDSLGVPFSGYAALCIRHRLLMVLKMALRFRPVAFSALSAFTDGCAYDPAERVRRSPAEMLATKEACEGVYRVLTRRERDVLERYFVQGYTQAEVARQFGFTPQRIQQIVELAVRRARWRLSASGVRS